MPIQSMTNMLKEGMRAAISCQILEGDLPVTFRWERNGKPLIGTGYVLLIFLLFFFYCTKTKMVSTKFSLVILTNHLREVIFHGQLLESNCSR